MFLRILRYGDGNLTLVKSCPQKRHCFGLLLHRRPRNVFLQRASHDRDSEGGRDRAVELRRIHRIRAEHKTVQKAK